jgi:hypothetical protein
VIAQLNEDPVSDDPVSANRQRGRRPKGRFNGAEHPRWRQIVNSPEHL